MKNPYPGKATPRIDWKAERDRIDLAAVATGLLGPAPGRTGERGRRLWWPCPFHEDRNPSFCIDPGKPSWKCHGCGEHGDAASLVMRLERLSFPEAVSRLTGAGPAPEAIRRPRPEPKPPEPPAGPSGLPERDGRALVADSEARLWSPEGADALADLTGRRCLALGTIRAARLGWTPGVRIPTKGGGSFKARGVVVPWFDGDRLALVKVRQPEGETPKYAEAFRDRPTLYPGPEAIRPGRPLVVPEGEFDALLLGQDLGELAAVVTLGSASGRPDPGILGVMLAAPRWYVATDADPAGDRAAAAWPARARRARPPEPFGDWTEARQGGMSLRQWWSDFLGLPFPPYPWDDLAGWRWGPAPDPEPGILVDRPSPEAAGRSLPAPTAPNHEDNSHG